MVEGLLIVVIFVLGILGLVQWMEKAWRVLRCPAKRQDFKPLLMLLTAAFLTLLIACFITMFWLNRGEVESGRFASGYLYGKYGMHGHFEMSYSSLDQTNGLAVYSYSYGTNAGILTVAKQTNGHADTFYVVVSDEPRK